MITIRTRDVKAGIKKYDVGGFEDHKLETRN